jgi:hypothetical protein
MKCKNNNPKCIGKSATEYLEHLFRIHTFEECAAHTKPVFLLPDGIRFSVNDDSLISLFGLSLELDGKPRDIIRPVVIEDALKIQYTTTNVLTPLVYAESLPDILWHISTQAILYTRVTASLLKWIKSANTSTKYGKHPLDQLWLPCSSPANTVKKGDLVCIFNRRVGGWDGSCDCPVIDLLGAGGHLPSIWDPEKNGFRDLSVIENLQKEAKEELKLSFEEKDVHVFGGYCNDLTHELVIVAGIMVPPEEVPTIESFAQYNVKEDTMGIYLGTFAEVIRFYREDPTFFAGGQKAAPTNFPSCGELMQIIESFFRNL